MANEISLTVNLSVAKGSLRYTFASPPASINLTGNAAAGAVQNVSTTTEALSVVDITTPGVAAFINLTVGTRVEVGQMSGGTFVPVLRLDSGEPAVGRMATTALYAKVTVPTNGTANVQWQMFSE